MSRGIFSGNGGAIRHRKVAALLPQDADCGFRSLNSGGLVPETGRDDAEIESGVVRSGDRVAAAGGKGAVRGIADCCARRREQRTGRSGCVVRQGRGRVEEWRSGFGRGGVSRGVGELIRGPAAAYANLGVIAMRRKQWDRALELLQKAEKLDPKMAGVRLNIGLVKYRRGDYPGAIEPLASVVRDQPDSYQARYLLGLCEVFTQRYADAVSTLEPLWEKSSSDFMYLYVLGIAAHNAGNKELDEKALARLLEVGGETPEFHLILGKAYLNRHEPEKAVDGIAEGRECEFAIALPAFRVGDCVHAHG